MNLQGDPDLPMDHILNTKTKKTNLGSDRLENILKWMEMDSKLGTQMNFL